jgi:hypothetical protein
MTDTILSSPIPVSTFFLGRILSSPLGSLGGEEGRKRGREGRRGRVREGERERERERETVNHRVTYVDQLLTRYLSFENTISHHLII